MMPCIGLYQLGEQVDQQGHVVHTGNTQHPDAAGTLCLAAAGWPHPTAAGTLSLAAASCTCSSAQQGPSTSWEGVHARTLC